MATRQYYLKNREYIIQKSRKWALSNPEKRREISRRYARKIANSTYESLNCSATWKGRRAELYVLQKLTGSVDNNANGLNREFDILWKGKTIDVKSCNLYLVPLRKNKKTRMKQWVFNKNKGQANLYYCVCMIQNKPVKEYLIPKLYFRNGITIGYKKSKFDKFIFSSI